LLKWKVFPKKWKLTQHNGTLIKFFHGIFPEDYLHFKNCLSYWPWVMLKKLTDLWTRVTFPLLFPG
jgi:hypothetical protein